MQLHPKVIPCISLPSCSRLYLVREKKGMPIPVTQRYAFPALFEKASKLSRRLPCFHLHLHLDDPLATVFLPFLISSLASTPTLPSFHSTPTTFLPLPLTRGKDRSFRSPFQPSPSHPITPSPTPPPPSSYPLIKNTTIKFQPLPTATQASGLGRSRGKPYVIASLHPTLPYLLLFPSLRGGILSSASRVGSLWEGRS
jgi:hypothetical protein